MPPSVRGKCPMRTAEARLRVARAGDDQRQHGEHERDRPVEPPLVFPAVGEVRQRLDQEDRGQRPGEDPDRHDRTRTPAATTRPATERARPRRRAARPPWRRQRECPSMSRLPRRHCCPQRSCGVPRCRQASSTRGWRSGRSPDRLSRGARRLGRVWPCLAFSLPTQSSSARSGRPSRRPVALGGLPRVACGLLRSRLRVTCGRLTGRLPPVVR